MFFDERLSLLVNHTSIKERLKPEFDLSAAVQEQVDYQVLRTFSLPLKPLVKFEGTVNGTYQSGILFDFEDYLDLVDTTGRIIREGKRGAIPISHPPILQRLNIDLDTWLKNCTQLVSRGADHSISPLVRTQRADFPHWAHDNAIHLSNGIKTMHDEFSL